MERNGINVNYIHSPPHMMLLNVQCEKANHKFRLHLLSFKSSHLFANHCKLIPPEMAFTELLLSVCNKITKRRLKRNKNYFSLGKMCSQQIMKHDLNLSLSTTAFKMNPLQSLSMLHSLFVSLSPFLFPSQYF